MPTELIDDVYDITCAEEYGMRFRSYLADWDVPTLVDTTYDELSAGLFDGLDALGIRPERLVITHAHGDHVGAVDAVVDRYGPETWVPAESTLPADTEPDHRYKHGDAVGPLEAVHVPGHTPDSHALVNEAAGVLVTGDVLIGADWRGHPPGYLVIPPQQTSDDLDAAEANLERLLTYEFDAALVYHGTAVLEGARDQLERYLTIPRTPY